ncbi:MAG: menaquinone biosynthesis family protein [Phycisphaerae bacterium]
MKIRLAHCPDVGDGFMFYPLAEGKIDTGDFEFELVAHDLQALNDHASRGKYEITSISAHSYAYARNRYVLSPAGATFGTGNGPMVVAREGFDPESLSDARVAIPGATTSASLLLQLCLPRLRTQLIPHEQIIPAIQTGVVDCGLLIHAAQLTYPINRLRKVKDLGQWWARTTDGLPLPTTCSCISKSLDDQVQAQLAGILSRSVAWSLNHRDEALEWAVQFVTPREPKLADRLVEMYIGQLSVDMSDAGREALHLFLEMGAQADLTPLAVPLEFAPTPQTLEQ